RYTVGGAPASNRIQSGIYIRRHHQVPLLRWARPHVLFCRLRIQRSARHDVRRYVGARLIEPAIRASRTDIDCVSTGYLVVHGCEQPSANADIAISITARDTEHQSYFYGPARSQFLRGQKLHLRAPNWPTSPSTDTGT